MQNLDSVALSWMWEGGKFSQTIPAIHTRQDTARPHGSLDPEDTTTPATHGPWQQQLQPSSADLETSIKAQIDSCEAAMLAQDTQGGGHLEEAAKRSAVEHESIHKEDHPRSNTRQQRQHLQNHAFWRKKFRRPDSALRKANCWRKHRCLQRRGSAKDKPSARL